nr:hypothetical protein [Tanacetum cinerariifolium]
MAEAIMSSLDKSNTASSYLYKGLQIVTKLLKEIKNVVKEDPVMNNKINEAIETFTKISINITEVLSLVKGFNFFDLQSTVKDLQAHALKQDKEEGKGIATKEQVEDQRKMVKASSIVRPDPDALVLVPYTINGKLFHLTAEQIQAHLDKEEQIKKIKEETKLLAINKPRVIKDAKHEVLKKKHTENVIKSLKLKKHKYDNYMWTINSRLKPEKISDIKIHPKTKPVVITVYRVTNGKNFDVHNHFAFGEFGISKLDELWEIIPKKKNVVVKDLMNSLSRRYERIKKNPKELGIPSAFPAPTPEQASSKSSRRKRKHIELEGFEVFWEREMVEIHPQGLRRIIGDVEKRE